MENFTNLMREKSHTNPGMTESPKQEEPKEAHCKTHNIKMANFQDKERILKAAREKKEVCLLYTSDAADDTCVV